MTGDSGKGNSNSSNLSNPNINSKMKIKIITTGGTIEKTYDEEDGLLINRDSVVKEKIINKLRLPYTDLIIENVLSKDSLEMNDEDRKLLCDVISASLVLSYPIVVLHGTDTVHTTAAYCQERIKQLKVPVVFTGAMVPLEMANSDGLQNVTEALVAAKILGPGFYLSFHNQLFTVPHFRKNRQRKTFEAI